MAAGAAMTVLLPASPARASTLPAPTDLQMSPVGACPAKTPPTIGLDDVTLYAVDGSIGQGAVQLTFTVTNTATSAQVLQTTVSGSAGTTAVLPIQRSILQAAATGAITEFSWNVVASNGSQTSPASQTCSFYYDTTFPDVPTITQTTSSYTLGDPVQFKISPAASGATAASYKYGVNFGASRTIAADSSGGATITVTPTFTGSNMLSVTALSPGGNPSQPATLSFNAANPPPAADGDMTSDGIPDLVTVGGTAGVAPGLWVAPGQAAAGGTTGSGPVITPATDIGENGSGLGSNSPTAFNGAQVITGRFYGEGLQDYLVYYPVYTPGGPFAGTGIYIRGGGHGTFLDGPGGASVNSADWQFTDPHGDIPLQVANGYNADTSDTPNNGPDLLTVSGDPANGFYLEDYTDFGAGLINSSVPLLSTASPDGTMDWNDWQISTTQDAAGVELFLYDAATHALYLWKDFTVDGTSNTASYTQYLISSDWNPGTITTLRAADINGDGTPDLWTVSPDGVVTSWLVTGLAGTPAITSQSSQPLLTPTHLWQLNTSDTQGTSDNGSGTQLPLSATGNVTWQTVDQLPAATFDGSTAALSTTAPAINTAGSFSVSAWADPASLSGTVLSESDTANPALAVWLSNGHWQAGVTSKSSKNPVWTAATAGNSYNAKPNTWTHIIVTYDASTSTLTLYLNGSKAASVAAGPTWTPAAGTFTLGAQLTGGALGKFFAGGITDVQVWDGATLSAAQAAAFTG